MYKEVVVMVMLVHLAQCTLYAQKADGLSISDYDIALNVPEGFDLSIQKYRNPNLQLFYNCAKNDGYQLRTHPRYQLTNKDSSVLIFPMPHSANIKTWHSPRYFPGNHMAFFNLPNAWADTIDYSVRYYRAQEIEETRTNADRIYQFTHKCRFVNDDGYKKHRIISYLKQDQSWAKVLYLFKDSTIDIDHFIKTSGHIIRFTKDEMVLSDNLDQLEEKYYITVSENVMNNLLKSCWNKGLIYHDLPNFTEETFAYVHDAVVISVHFSTNKLWPYIDKFDIKSLQNKSNDKWGKANQDFKKYLQLAIDDSQRLSDKKLEKAHADEGYIFDFSHEEGDFYRNEYQDCKVILLHKENVGSILLKYYYHRTDKHKIDSIIEQTLGAISFFPKEYFEINSDSIYPY